MTQGLYHYEPKGDHLTIFRGKKKLHTPNGNVVTAYTPQMADLLLELLEQDTDHTSCATPLCYHYTYCDLMAQYDRASVLEDVKTCIRENIADDPMLFFKAEEILGTAITPDDITEEQYIRIQQEALSQLTGHAERCTMYQLVAMIVIYCSFDSLVLSWRMVKDIIDNPSADIDAFIADLTEYCKVEELSCPDDIREIIDAFSFYYALKDE